MLEKEQGNDTVIGSLFEKKAEEGGAEPIEEEGEDVGKKKVGK